MRVGCFIAGIGLMILAIAGMIAGTFWNLFIDHSACSFPFLKYSLALADVMPLLFVTFIMPFVRPTKKARKTVAVLFVVFSSGSALCSTIGFAADMISTSNCFKKAPFYLNLYLVVAELLVFVLVPGGFFLFQKLSRDYYRNAPKRELNRQLKLILNEKSSKSKVREVLEYRGFSEVVKLTPLGKREKNFIMRVTERKHSGLLDVDLSCCLCSLELDQRQPMHRVPFCEHDYHKTCFEQQLHSQSVCAVCSNVLLLACVKQLHNIPDE